jgi:uncharacterized membrane protein YoaK (UPF0700 family)
LTGMVLVAAMAIQNAVHRIYLGGAPLTALMTGTTTQIMIDLADLILPGGAKSQSNARLTKMSVNVLVFALGCGAAALLFMRFEMWCFVLPPIVVGLSLAARIAQPRCPRIGVAVTCRRSVPCKNCECILSDDRAVRRR